MKQGSSPEYRQLVQDLMLFGWYRAGAEPVTEGNPLSDTFATAIASTVSHDQS